MTHVESKSQPLRVCAFGMSERTTKAMEIIFERETRGTCVLSDEGAADVAVIDVDTPEGRPEFDRQRRQHPARPLVLLAFDEADARTLNGIVVAKPLKVDRLIGVLKEVAERIAKERAGGEAAAGSASSAATGTVPESAKTAGTAGEGVEAVVNGEDLSIRFPGQWVPPPPPASAPIPTPVSVAVSPAEDAVGERPKGGRSELSMARAPTEATDRAIANQHARGRHYYISAIPDVDLDVPEQRAKIFYDPNQFLQGFVQKAVRLGIDNGSAVHLSGVAFGKIEIYPSARQVRVSAAAGALYAVARTPLRDEDVTFELIPDSAKSAANDAGIEPLDALLWRLALWASRGRLPIDANLDGAVVLRRWPNLPRLLYPPHATRIAGLWSRRATRLSLTAKTLAIPQRYVFAFYSACAALDLVIADRRRTPRPEVVETPNPERRSLFRLLLDKLKQGWED